MSMTRRIPEVSIKSFPKDVVPSNGEIALVRFNAKLSKEAGEEKTVIKYHAAMREFISKVKKKKDFLPAFYEFKAVCISLNLYYSKHGRRASLIPEDLNVSKVTPSGNMFMLEPSPDWRTRVDDLEIRNHLEALERPIYIKDTIHPIENNKSLDSLLSRANARVLENYDTAPDLTKKLKSKIEDAILEIEAAKEKLEGLLKLDSITSSDPTIFKLLISLKDDLDSI